MVGSMLLLLLTFLLDVGTVWKWVANILEELATTTFSGQTDLQQKVNYIFRLCLRSIGGGEGLAPSLGQQEQWRGNCVKQTC